MVAYEYEYPDMFAGMPAYFGAILDRFGDVGLTSAALDEFTYLRTVPSWQIGERQYRGRYYSPAMDSAFRAKYRTDMAGTMLAMRMVPERQEQQRMQAVNRYMDLMREGVVRAQASFYDQAKAKLGKDAWIGWHDTYHNRTVDHRRDVVEHPARLSDDRRVDAAAHADRHAVRLSVQGALQHVLRSERLYPL